jgi:hypothetical protein
MQFLQLLESNAPVGQGGQGGQGGFDNSQLVD